MHSTDRTGPTSYLVTQSFELRNYECPSLNWIAKVLYIVPSAPPNATVKNYFRNSHHIAAGICRSGSGFPSLADRQVRVQNGRGRRIELP